MKRFIITLCCLVYCLSNILSQQKTMATEEDATRIEITPYVDPDLGFSKEVTKQLTNKMNALLAKSGMAGGHNQRFVLATNINVLSEDIVMTTKDMYQYELEVSFALGDGVEGTKFATNSIVVKGLADTKAGAYIAALKKIPTSHPSFAPFFEKGKMEIANYFATKCDFILKEANAKADRKEYDEAISYLLTVPTVCKECFDKAQDKSIEIYKRKIENDCQINISNAKTKIAANQWDEALDFLAGYTPDMECYSEASSLIVNIQNHRCAVALGQAESAWAKRDAVEAAKWLGEIPFDSECNKNAENLRRQISSRLDERERRNWEFKMQENERKWEFKMQEHSDKVATKRALIDAVQNIGVAFGKNQKPVTYKTKSWF